MAPTHAKPPGWALPLSLTHTHIPWGAFVCVWTTLKTLAAKGRLASPCGVSWSQDIQDIYLSYKSIAVAVAVAVARVALQDSAINQL